MRQSIINKQDNRWLSNAKRYILLVVFSAISYLGHSQEEVSGTVSSADSVIAGATVQVKGTKTTTQTDRNGKFSIAAPAGATLVITYTGFISQEVKATTDAPLAIELKATDQQLGEVVVVAYSTQKKETLTGSIATVSGKDIAVSPSPNVINSLTGRLAGLTVSQRSGEPGRDDPGILIRGIGTTGD